MLVPQQGGRVNQKRRTHRAIVDAAVDLIAEGRTPSVAEAAERALVSRTTAYRYFPTQQSLLVEAALAAAASPLDHIFEQATGSIDVGVRVDAVAVAFNREVAEREAEFRLMLRIYLDQWLAEGELVRPGRRLEWIDEALRPLRDQLGEEARGRLTAALAMVMGIEAYVVARDVCQLAPPDAQRVMRWAAKALLEAATSEARVAEPHPSV